MGTGPNTQETSRSTESPQPSSQTFKISKSLYLSTSFLLNDIQNFVDIYKQFRDEYTQYFDSDHDDNGEILAHNQSKSEQSSNEELNPIQSSEGVPVEPALAKAFKNLEFIDTYRVTGEARLLDELIYSVQSPSLQSSEQFDSDEDENEDQDSDGEASGDAESKAFNFYLTRQPLEKITEEID